MQRYIWEKIEVALVMVKAPSSDGVLVLLLHESYITQEGSPQKISWGYHVENLPSPAILSRTTVSNMQLISDSMPIANR